MREVLSVLTLLVGFGLAVVGFLLAPPIGPTSSIIISNPRMPFAAGLFTIGIMTIFLSAVVYELYRDRHS